MTSVFCKTAVAAIFSTLAAVPAFAQENKNPVPESIRHEYSADQARTPHKETSLERCRKSSFFQGSVPEALREKDVMTLFDPSFLVKGDAKAVRYVDMEAASKDGSLGAILEEHFNRLLSDPLYTEQGGGGIFQLVSQSHDMGITFHAALTPEGTISPESKLRFANTKYCTVNLGGFYMIESAMWNIKMVLGEVGYLPRPRGRLEKTYDYSSPVDGIFNSDSTKWIPADHRVDNVAPVSSLEPDLP
ncbi:MAG: hypothetical protein LRY36_02050 [Alphaproteobacteria bacterium]|nr:hypothetical protein [Alphaproteobacteria bacterium]